MSRLKAYPEYKDSGDELIGKVPKHWNVLKWQYLIDILTDYTANGSFAGLAKNVKYLDNPSYARLVRLTDLRVDFSNSGIYVDKKAYEYLSKSKLLGDEILIANVGAYAGISMVMPNRIGRHTLGPNMILIKFKEGLINKDFAKIMVNSIYIKAQLIGKANESSAQPSLNKTDIKNTVCVFPNKNKQYSIVKFLNKKTLEINDLISDKENLIELLEEKHMAVITESVTKGLDPTVKMKDSGIEWIGKIPEEWVRTKLKYLSKVTAIYGLNGSAESYADYGMRLLRTTDIHGNGRLKSDDAVYLNIDEIKHTPDQILKENDIVFSRSGTVGRTYIHETSEVMTFASYLVKFSIIDKYYPKYIYHFTKGHHFIGWINSILITSTISNVNGNRYANMPIVIPTYKEQCNISKYLDKKASEFDSLIKKIDKQISKLKEYRESLIYEAVTGKIDLRDYAPKTEEVY